MPISHMMTKSFPDAPESRKYNISISNISHISFIFTDICDILLTSTRTFKKIEGEIKFGNQIKLSINYLMNFNYIFKSYLDFDNICLGNLQALIQRNILITGPLFL